MPIVLDEARFPVVRAKFSGAATDADYTAFLDRSLWLMNRCDREGGAWGLVVDGGDVDVATATQRRLMGQFLKENAELIARANVGLALFLENPIHRGVLTAILWVTSFPCPLHVCASMHEGEEWIRAQLRDRRG